MTTYEQLHIVAPRAIEITLKLGVVTETNHLQWMFEVRSATDDTLLAMSSKHHAHSGDWNDELASINSALAGLLASYVDPF